MLDYLAIKQIHEENISKKANVNGVGLGVKWVNGHPTEQPAILIFVQKKLSKRGIINKFSAEELIPSEIEGIPTDVIEVGIIKKQELKSRMRPLKPGYSVGHRNITAGTIGGFFIDRDGDPIILSNCHVLANENNAKIGDLIYQPGPLDNSADLNYKDWVDPVANLPYFGTLKSFVTLQQNNNTQDSAIAKIHDKIIKSGLIDSIYPVVNQPLSGFNIPTVSMQVQKLGRTTGYTTGRIIGTNASFTVGYDFGNAKFNNCVVCSVMSKGGDSGAMICDMNMQGVALLFAGSPKVTIATPIQPIIDHYGLQLWNTAPIPSMELDDGKWAIMTARGSITQGPDFIKINSPANCYCFLQRPLSNFETIRVTVNTGTDKGASWGPGISILWPNGILKINLRYTGSFAGVLNGNANLGIGQTQPNREYVLRIKKTNNTYIGEIQDNNKWYTVIEIPTSIFPSPPLNLVIGKTDELGYVGDYSTIGDVGECIIRDLDVS